MLRLSNSRKKRNTPTTPPRSGLEHTPLAALNDVEIPRDRAPLIPLSSIYQHLTDVPMSGVGSMTMDDYDSVDGQSIHFQREYIKNSSAPVIGNLSTPKKQGKTTLNHLKKNGVGSAVKDSPNVYSAACMLSSSGDQSPASQSTSWKKHVKTRHGMFQPPTPEQPHPLAGFSKLLFCEDPGVARTQKALNMVNSTTVEDSTPKKKNSFVVGFLERLSKAVNTPPRERSSPMMTREASSSILNIPKELLKIGSSEKRKRVEADSKLIKFLVERSDELKASPRILTPSPNATYTPNHLRMKTDSGSKAKEKTSVNKSDKKKKKGPSKSQKNLSSLLSNQTATKEDVTTESAGTVVTEKVDMSTEDREPISTFEDDEVAETLKRMIESLANEHFKDPSETQDSGEIQSATTLLASSLEQADVGVKSVEPEILLEDCHASEESQPADDNVSYFSIIAKVSPAKNAETDSEEESIVADDGNIQVTGVVKSEFNHVEQQQKLMSIISVKPSRDASIVVHPKSETIHPPTRPNTPTSKHLPTESMSSAVISPAKDDELAAAHKRMMEFLANKKLKDSSKTQVSVSTASATILTTSSLEPAEVVEQTVKPESQVGNVSEKEPAKDIDLSSKTAQVSPAKDDEIAAANRRMQEFLAKKQAGSVPKKNLSIGVKAAGTIGSPLHVGNQQTYEVVEPVTTGEHLDIEETEQHQKLRSSEPLDSSKHFSVLVQSESARVALPTRPSTPTSKHLSTESMSSAVISPAKDDELAAAHKRMMEFLASKSLKGPSKIQVSVSTGSATIPSATSLKPAEEVVKPKFTPMESATDEHTEGHQKRTAYLESEKTEAHQNLGSSMTVDNAKEAPVAVQTEPADIAPPSRPNTPTSKHLPSESMSSAVISPAKDDEIAAAHKRMMAFLANKNKNSENLYKTQARSTTVSVTVLPIISLKPADVVEQTIKTKVLLEVCNTSEVEPTVSSVPTSKTAQVSPAKDDEIAEANRRMQEFLAKKQAESVPKKIISVGVTAEGASTSLNTGKIQEEHALDSRKIGDSAKDGSAVVQANLNTILPTRQSSASTSVNQSTETMSSGVVSPAKDDEIAAAHRRMQEFLAKKQAGNVSKKIISVGVTKESASDTGKIQEEHVLGSRKTGDSAKGGSTVIQADSNTIASTVQSTASPSKNQSTGPLSSAAISPAKDDEIAEANRRMQEFLAKKQAASVPKKIIAVGVTTEGASTSLDTGKVQEERAPSLNKTGNSAKDESAVVQADSNTILPTVQSSAPTSKNQSTEAMSSGVVSPAKDDEIAAAHRRMQEFLAKKQAGNVPKKIISVGVTKESASDTGKIQEEHVLGSRKTGDSAKGGSTVIQADSNTIASTVQSTASPSKNQSTGPLSSGVVSPAKDDEIAAAHRRMQEFLAKKQAGNVSKKTISVGVTKESTSDTGMIQKEHAPSLNKTGDSAKDESVVVQADSNNILPTVPSNASTSKNQSTEAMSSAVISPAKDDELAAAHKRMMEFLAKKQAGNVPKKTISVGVTTEGSSTSLDTGKIQEEHVLGSRKTGDSAKGGSTVVQADSNTIVSTIQSSASTSKNQSTGILPSAVISPAKDDELAAAHKRMMEFLAKKQSGTVSRKLVVNDTPKAEQGTIETKLDVAPTMLIEVGKSVESATDGSKVVEIKAEAETSTTASEVTKEKSVETPSRPRTVKIEKVILDGMPVVEPPKPRRKQKYDFPTNPIRAAGINIVRYGVSPPTNSLQTISEGSEESADDKPTETPNVPCQTSATDIVEDPEVVEAKRFIRAYLDNSYTKRPGFDPLKYLCIIPTATLQDISEENEELEDTDGIQISDEVSLKLQTENNIRPAEASQISPATELVIEETNRRMQVCLAEKQSEDGATIQTEIRPSTSSTSENGKTTSLATAEPQQPISPAKEDEIAAAHKRMQEFLAKKQAEIAPKKIIPIGVEVADPKPAQLVDRGMLNLEKNPGRITVAETHLTPMTLRDTSESQQKENIVSNTTLDAESKDAQVSLAKDVKIVDANRKMQEFLVEEQAENLPKKFITSKIESESFACSQVKADLEVKSVDAKDKNPLEMTDGKSEKLQAATEEEIANAHRKMMEFLAQKQANSAPKNRFTSVVKTEDPNGAKKLEEQFESAGRVAKDSSKGPIVDLPTGTLPEISVSEDHCPSITDTLHETIETSERFRIVDANQRMTEFSAQQEITRFPKHIEYVGFLEHMSKTCVESSSSQCTTETASDGMMCPAASRISPANGKELDEMTTLLDKQPTKTSVPTNTCSVISGAEHLSKPLGAPVPRISMDDQKTPIKSSMSPPAKINSSHVTEGVCPAKELELTEVCKKLTELIENQQANSIQMKILSSVAETYDQITSNIETPIKKIPSRIGTPGTTDLPGCSSWEGLQRPGTPGETPTKQSDGSVETSPVAQQQINSKAISTPTRFSRRGLSNPTPEKNPPVAVTDILFQDVQILEHTPSQFHPADPRWARQQLAHLLNGTDPVAPKPTTISIPTTIALSVPVFPAPLVDALTELEEEKKAKDEQCRSPLRIKSCFPNLHMFENVPEFFSHAHTPCSTPVSLMFDKYCRPSRPKFNRREKLRNRRIELVFPKPAKKTVRFCEKLELFPKEPNLDEVVPGSWSEP